MYRGSDNPKLQSINGLSSHLRTRHPQFLKKTSQQKNLYSQLPAVLKICQLQVSLSLLQVKKEQYPYLTSDQSGRGLKCCNLQFLARLTIAQKLIQILKKSLKFSRSVFEMIVLDLALVNRE